MLDLPNKLSLTDCQSGHVVSADFIKLTRKIAQTKIDGRWWAGLNIPSSKRQEEADHHWRWAKIVGSYRADAFVESIAVQTPDQEIQGAIVYRLNGNSVLENGFGAVHVEYLAAAPRNRDGLVTEPFFRGTGLGLVLFAIANSYKLGLDGRINLYSLPTPETIQWYTNRGFVETELDKNGMMLFELSADNASAWLRKKGLL